ncbi:diacylglycerol acyltransferase-domain-containing protein [Coniochaeta sp. 2T2.1]|nr:diacylglycerol acyltransferase-domain-containing protein [Coniochaeta sp. 2T2.1]
MGDDSNTAGGVVTENGPSYAEVVKEGDAQPNGHAAARPDSSANRPQVNGSTPDSTEHASSNGDMEKSYAEAVKEDTDESSAGDQGDGSTDSRNDHTTPGSSSQGGELRRRKQPETNGSTNGRKPKYDPHLSAAEQESQEHEEWDRDYGYQAAGIRFAPWNVPIKRRLQTLTVLGHCLSIASLVSVFFFLCAIPLTWPLLIPYLIHVLVSNAASDGKLRFRSERFRRHRMWRLFAGYFPATLHKTEDLPPTRKYIFGYHPHGIISHGAFAAFATEALGFADKFPGITNSLLTLDSNFRIPIYRDYILAMGLRSVSKESIGNILTRGGANGEGMGRAVTIVVGGARESLEAQPGMMRLILKERKGFIKLAVRTGADLVPVLAFGENDLYDQMNPKAHPWLHSVQMFVLRVWKFTLPFLHGRGIFNYDVGLMPYRRPLHVVVGKPIKVQQATGGVVDPAEVDRLHALYVEELCRIWETYKDVFAKERKEEMRILK